MSQPRPLAEQLKVLENLQELDLKIDSLKKNKSSIPAALKTLDEQVNKSQHQVNAKKHALEEIEKIQRQTRAAMDLNKDRLTRSSSRLEGVQNSNEFQAANKELEQLRKLSATLDEQAKKADADSEAVKKELETLTASFEKTKGERDAQAATLSGQDGQLDGQIASLHSERAQFTSQIEAKILAQYDRVRGARAGMGIAPAVAGRCQACNMMVPPQLYNELHKGHILHSCPSCHRILFVRQNS